MALLIKPIFILDFEKLGDFVRLNYKNIAINKVRKKDYLNHLIKLTILIFIYNHLFIISVFPADDKNEVLIEPKFTITKATGARSMRGPRIPPLSIL